MHLLLIEDDLDLGRALLQGLKAEGFSTEWLRRSADAPPRLHGCSYDCVLLDLSLPDGAGFDLLTRWRAAGDTLPILIITARSALEERLAGLDNGADDFIVKPFATPELASRVRAVARRYALQATEVWRFGSLHIEPRRHQARLDGEPVDLSAREFRLLFELARQAGKVVPKGVLAQRLEPAGEPIDFPTLEVHMSNLRRKIGPQRVRTLRGVGYLFTGAEAS